MSFRLLSYPLSPRDPVWPGQPPAAGTQPVMSIANGDVANTTILHLFSHSGTHLDAPKHFNDVGLSAYQVPIENYVFDAPVVLEVPKPDGGLIMLAEVEPYAEALERADVALLRTNWSSIRASDPRRYANKRPLLHPDAARFLVDNYPRLKGVAIDAISIGAPDYFQESVDTHHILTGWQRTDGRYVLILEDLRIDSDLGRARRIYAWPLLIEGSDSSPCTIAAEFGD